MGLQQLRRRFPIGRHRPLLVTEVTRMSGAVCVAAYDFHDLRIFRPLPRTITNWPTRVFTSGQITVGTVLGVTAADPQRASAYPHASEDFRLADSPIRLGILSSAEVVEALRPTADHTVSEIFEGNLNERKYVDELTACRSLGAILVAVAQIRPFANTYDKLRVTFTDGSGTFYNLPVTDMAVHQILAQQNAEAAVQHLRGELAHHNRDTYIMLRLGLARAFSGGSQNWHPMRCYLQCNGFLFP